MNKSIIRVIVILTVFFITAIIIAKEPINLILFVFGFIVIRIFSND